MSTTHESPSPTRTAADYFAANGLSNSAMKDLAVSPLRFWYKHINTERPEDEPTPEMQLGSALHCAILEPNEFDKRYAPEFTPPEGCLTTIEEIREWVRSKGGTPKGTRKSDVITSALSFNCGEKPLIFDTLCSDYGRLHAGKVLFNSEDWQRIGGMASAIIDEPHIQKILASGTAEMEIFAKDQETGVQLKGKLDWAATTLTLDLKTFQQKRGKSIDQSVADAIFYECYYRQAYFYSLLRGWPKTWGGDFVIAFVESEPPHEVRIRRLLPKTGAQPNMYWERARVEVRGLIHLYAECVAQFGDKPWRYAQEITVLEDEEMPGMAY